MFDTAKHKRRCILLIVLFLILFLIFAYLNYSITYPFLMEVTGYDMTVSSTNWFPGVGQAILIVIFIFIAAILFVPDVIFLILIFVNIYNYHKFTKIEEDQKRQ